jgi:hypothetical protein
LKRALPLAVFALSAVWLLTTSNLDGDFRIDEAHKISETYFLRLIEQGDFRDPAWLSSPVERANPQVGKVVFGLAMQIRGVPLPADATFAENPDPRGSPPQFRRGLRPVRTVSALATAGTAALACAMTGSPIAPLLFLSSFAARTYGAAGVYDALLAFFFVAAAAPLRSKVTWPRTVASAVLAALAFGTRVSGVLAIVGTVVLVRDWRKALAAIAICVGTATILNPFYWVPGPESLLVRPFARYATQLADLSSLLAATGEHRLGPLERVQFVSEYAFGDLSGALVLLGLAFTCIWVWRDRPGVPVLAWAAAIVVVFTIWVPVAYPRYVLAAMAPLAIASDYGWRWVITKVSTSLREKANGK